MVIAKLSVIFHIIMYLTYVPDNILLTYYIAKMGSACVFDLNNVLHQILFCLCA